MRSIEVPSYIKGLIFDCDGTLVDSMPLHMKAWEYAVTNGGAVWNYEFFFSKKGMQEEDIVELYNKQSLTPLNCIATVEAKHNYFRNHRSEFKPIRPVVDVVLRYNGILPMAVASGGISENVLLQIEALGIREYFNIILTANDNIKPKPHPDIFLEAAAHLGVLPNLCQVFEDGDLGLEAAKKAGMVATDVRPFF
jgi:beta-phosphoglucomutase-like phosphatase (HAD superfamily)